MFTSASPLFLVLASEAAERILHQGKVLEVTGEDLVAEFVDAIAPAAGSDVQLYTEFRGKFHQQAATVVALRQAEPFPVLALKTIGLPAPAEARNSFRVSTASMEVAARIEKGDLCKVVDISPEGFAVITSPEKEYLIGNLVDVSLTFEGISCSDQARVQTLRVLPNGNRRYGMLALAKETATLRKTLGRLTATVQRMQLKRLSRTG